MHKSLLAISGAILALSLAPASAEAVVPSVVVTGYHCDAYAVCVNFVWRIYQDRTYIGSGADAGTWSTSTDPYTGQLIFNATGISGVYELYVDQGCADGNWNGTGFASVCRF